ncbi:MAG: dolichol monophosphate mannose synthase [Candidatus Nitrosocaldaceae archaeon]|nr:MAG: dolichol monophosphate mannose synthase [Candidatus Nitrosocaldaceae archaeon]
MQTHTEWLDTNKVALSIIVPTYNESYNITRLLDEISANIPNYIPSEIIIVDDNSPDGTGIIAEDYAKRSDKIIRVLHRDKKEGLSKAILDGIKASNGDNILVMDADFSHPPSIIPDIIKELDKHDLVIASRYVNGSKIVGWPITRKLMSVSAKKLAECILKVSIKDPLSGFFAFKKRIISNIKFDALGYKLLLEIIVKSDKIKVKEIPYTFVNRDAGNSKLDINVAIDYIRSIWRLYRYGRRSEYGMKEKRSSVLFLSKAARFYTVGLSGLFVNYSMSLLLSLFIGQFYGSLGGIISSITSNFILNKIWTFEDRNFKPKHFFKQYGLYSLFSSLGAFIQLSTLDLFMNRYDMDYSLALLLAVGLASIGNFLFNKKITFKEKVWG